MHDTFPFLVDGVLYTSVYQCMMCYQMLKVDDVESFRELRKLESAVLLKERAARLSRRYPRKWDKHAYESCLAAVRAKFNGPCKHTLMKEGEIAYISPDLFWGTGGSEAAALIGLPYRGRNVYGEILTTVREELLDKEYQD